jgi:EAL domain-containing protein (putative c-di-GMP-specific phosphodiesterase class I)/amino acid transporter/GGDEF domain-containing protein
VFALSIGASIGWGSFIVTCNTYLQKSGILGTVGGLLIGMAIVFVVAWNLQYMIQLAPGAGGVYSFQKRINGDDVGFVTFWFVLLVYMAILWANVTAVPLFVRLFLGDSFQFGLSYEILEYKVWFGEAFLSVGAVLLIGWLCSRSARWSNRAMTFAALTFVLGFAVCAIIAAVEHESRFSYAPMFPEDSDALAHIVRIAAISPWAFIGFENIAHFSEEYDFPIKKVRGILLGSVLVTTALYLLVSILSISAYPPEYGNWLDYLRDMENLEGLKAVPAFYAAHYYLGNAGIVILMLALFGVILTSLIANSLALSRLLYAAGRQGDAPAPLGHLSASHVPDNAIRVIVIASLLIPFLGRTTIGWIVDVTTLGATMVYWLVSHGVYRHAKNTGRRLEKRTGIAGMVIMTVILLLLLVPGLLPFHAMETESYALFIVWALLGMLYFSILLHKDHKQLYGKSVIVWIVMLMLILFASLMWAARETESATREVVAEISEYYQSRPGADSKEDAAHRTLFLQEQAQEINTTNTLYIAFALFMFLCVSGVLLYKDHKKVEAMAAERQRLIDETERDRLTGLYQWNYFLIYVNKLYHSDSQKPMDAVVINVERFRSVNSLHGREFGDNVLREIGSQIKRFVDKNGGMACRSEADYFSIYCPHRDDWQSFLENFQTHINEAFPLADIHLRMGVRPWQAGQEPIPQLDCARIASKKLSGIYTTKAIIFDEDMRLREQREHRLLSDLSHALENRELKVYYQPKYDIQGDEPRLCSAEALVRWQHSELGLVSPGIFIPLFERTGKITELDEFVWREAAHQIAIWRDRYGTTLPVSVNLSRADVFAPGLSAMLEDIIKQHGLKPGDLKLEVTESAYTDNPSQLIRVIEHLRGSGYQIEMDDFGSGYSSLNMLSSMPIDILKMDIAFIRNIEHNEKDLRLVELVVDIARYFKLPVVAEGVETEGQLKLLRKAGCNLVQGYYFSRPLPPEEFEQKFLANKGA